MDFLQIVMTPFSWIMKTLYFVLFENYGLALFVFALIVKVILFPLSLKGKKSMIKTTALQGKMQQLQKQYGRNREKYNEEVQKLYQKEGVNPMGGCLWSMLPLVILFPLYAVVRRPLRYLMGLSDTVIEAVTETVTGMGVTLNAGYPEISIISAFHRDPAILAAAQSVEGVTTELFGMNFSFLGIDLAATPTLRFWEGGLSWAAIGLFLLPILSAVFSLLSSIIMNKTNKLNNPNAGTDQNGKMMLLMGPVMSLWIGFVMPAGMCLYWIANSVFGVVQELLAHKILKKDYEIAAAQRAKQEALEKEEEKRKKKALAEARARRIEEAKKTKKKKTAKKSDEESGPDAAASRVGMRKYARGRSYDPNRYGGVTEYKDPSASVDEEAIEAALQAKAEAAEKAREEDEIEREAEAIMAAEDRGEAPETEAVDEVEADGTDEAVETDADESADDDTSGDET